MDVHHHPDIHHKTKKWREYFLEFLMIFLAVTLGFFAESYREHLADKRKEKEIILALLNDLKKDTTNLNNIVNRYMPGHGAWVDSAEVYFNTLTIKGNEKKIAKALINSTNWNFYSPPQVALEILKTSGTFNLIKNETVRTEIINFNALVNTYVNYSQFMLIAEHSVDTATAGILIRGPLRILIAQAYIKTNAEYGSIADSDIPDGPLLKTYDRNLYLNFIRKLDVMDYLLNDLLGLYKKILREEVSLIEVLNKEYNFH